MTTLREWFNDEKVDWSSLIMVCHTMGPNSFAPGWSIPETSVKFDFTNDSALDTTNHPVLDHKFYDGFGAPEAPMFVAQDKDFIYFPSQYDGATTLVKVAKNIDYYMDVRHETPYPGG